MYCDIPSYNNLRSVTQKPLVPCFQRVSLPSENRASDRHTHTHTHTHRPSTVTLAVHARRGLIANQVTSTQTDDKEHLIKQRFVKFMKQGNVKAAVKLLDNSKSAGVLYLESIIHLQ